MKKLSFFSVFPKIDQTFFLFEEEIDIPTAVDRPAKLAVSSLNALTAAAAGAEHFSNVSILFWWNFVFRHKNNREKNQFTFCHCSVCL